MAWQALNLFVTVTAAFARWRGKPTKHVHIASAGRFELEALESRLLLSADIMANVGQMSLISSGESKGAEVTVIGKESASPNNNGTTPRTIDPIDLSSHDRPVQERAGPSRASNILTTGREFADSATHPVLQALATAGASASPGNGNSDGAPPSKATSRELLPNIGSLANDLASPGPDPTSASPASVPTSESGFFGKIGNVAVRLMSPPVEPIPSPSLGDPTPTTPSEPVNVKKDQLWSQISTLFTPPPEYRHDVGGYTSVLDLADGGRIQTPAEWNARRVEIRDYWMNEIGQWPAMIQHPRIMIDNGITVDPHGITRHAIELETFPGTTSPAILVTPPGSGPFPAVLDLWYFPEESAGVVPSTNGRVDFAYQLATRGFVTLAMTQSSYRGDPETGLQYLSMLAYEANNAYNFLAGLGSVDPSRIGIVGHSFGGKWALFGGALTDNFAAVAVSDPGIVWDESRLNVNYWEPWYLGYELGASNQRNPGVPTTDNPRTGAYKRLFESGHDLTELHALLAPRPFLVAGGSEDTAARWRALNRARELNQFLGYQDRVAMTNRSGHGVDEATNRTVTDFFDYFLNA